MAAYHEPNDGPDIGRPSMQREVTTEIASCLAGLAAQTSSAERIAETVAATLWGIHQALVPIVGERGVAALYKRSLHLAKTRFVWLPDPQTSAPEAMDVGPLTTSLATQGAAEAAVAGARLLQDFHELLVTLIGPSLTERLLRPVWITFLSAPSAIDNTQGRAT